MLQTFGSGTHDYYLSTVGHGARLIDSLAVPWARLRAMPFMVRQAGLHQLDDSTCAIVPVYQKEFAILSASGRVTLGTHAEDLPVASMKVESSDTARVVAVAPGAKAGALDAGAWRDAVMVLFRGTTAQKGRILDLFDRADLRYRGSLALPFESMKIAIRADTLVAVGDVDAEPVVAAFIVQRGR